MPDMTQESWKGHAIHIRTIPVRRIVARVSAPDGYIAIVRIERSGEVLADWHLPRFSERWTRGRSAARRGRVRGETDRSRRAWSSRSSGRARYLMGLAATPKAD
jgi:hypothetical protein